MGIMNLKAICTVWFWHLCWHNVNFIYKQPSHTWTTWARMSWNAELAQHRSWRATVKCGACQISFPPAWERERLQDQSMSFGSGLGGSVGEEQAKLIGGVITERNLEDGKRTNCTLPGEAQRCQWDESQHQLGVTCGALFGPVASKQTACKGLAKWFPTFWVMRLRSDKKKRFSKMCLERERKWVIT